MLDKPKHAARLLGVSEATLYAWQSGRRQPSAAAARLLEVLAFVQAVSPSLYATLVEEVKPWSPPPKMKPALPYKAKPRTKEPPPEPGTPEAYQAMLLASEREYWLTEWENPHSEAIESLNDEEYARIKHLIAK